MIEYRSQSLHSGHFGDHDSTFFLSDLFSLNPASIKTTPSFFSGHSSVTLQQHHYLHSINIFSFLLSRYHTNYKRNTISLRFFLLYSCPVTYVFGWFSFFRRPFSGGVDTAKQDFENGWYVVVSKVRDRLVVALLSSPSVSLLLWV